MRNVHKTVHEERRTTRGYTYDPSEGSPSEFPFIQSNSQDTQIPITNGTNSTNSTTSTTRTRTSRTNTTNNSNTNNNSISNNNTVSNGFPSISDKPFDFDNLDDFDSKNTQSSTNTTTNTTTSKSIQSVLHPGSSDQDPGKFTVNVQLSDSIGPEDLKVSIKDHVMTIEAKKEINSPDGTSRVYQEFSRKFTLPPNVDMRAVRTMLSPQGDLKIEAPLPAVPAPALKALPAPTPKSQKHSVTFKRERDVPIKIGFM